MLSAFLICWVNLLMVEAGCLSSIRCRFDSVTQYNMRGTINLDAQRCPWELGLMAVQPSPIQKIVGSSATESKFIEICSYLLMVQATGFSVRGFGFDSR